jgi:hypothetical protein
VNLPRFAIVGHPNKGKSSLVATLCADDGVPVAPESGTTTRAVAYPMRIKGEVLYELVDTPGFQRARRALAWLRNASTSAADRAQSVARFVEQHDADPAMRAEVELLGPVVGGAGIIYVVDGAVPYGPEYEAEMEILRWTGRPSLAVINPIGGRAHVGQWHDALSQFFRVVREVDVLSAPLEQRLDLLRAFGELDEAWRPALAKAVAALTGQREANRRRAAVLVAQLLAEALSATFSQTLSEGGSEQALRSALETQYRDALRAMEGGARDRVEQVYQHQALARSETELAVMEDDLFAERAWEVFGLSRTALASVGATGGAAAGLGLDAILGGASLFLGSAVGAVAGGAMAWFASDQLASFSTEKLPFGEQVVQIRAGANRNLPFVLLGRARLHHALVSRRSHARREPLTISVDSGEAQLHLTEMDSAQQRSFAELFERITKQAPSVDDAVVASLAELISQLFELDDT